MTKLSVLVASCEASIVKILIFLSVVEVLTRIRGSCGGSSGIRVGNIDVGLEKPRNHFL